MAARIKVYHSEQDKVLRSMGKLLLLKVLTIFFQQPRSILSDIRYDVNNKPFLPNSGLDFSIAHSGQLIVCAITREGKIGVDTEQITNHVPDVLEDNFSEAEIFEIAQHKNPAAGFYQAWTRKEAVMKATGMGVLLPMSSINQLTDSVRIDDDTYYYKNLKISTDYASSVSTNFQCGATELLRVYPESLLSI